MESRKELTGPVIGGALTDLDGDEAAGTRAQVAADAKVEVRKTRCSPARQAVHWWPHGRRPEAVRRAARTALGAATFRVYYLDVPPSCSPPSPPGWPELP